MHASRLMMNVIIQLSVENQSFCDGKESWNIGCYDVDMLLNTLRREEAKQANH